MRITFYDFTGKPAVRFDFKPFTEVTFVTDWAHINFTHAHHDKIKNLRIAAVKDEKNGEIYEFYFAHLDGSDCLCLLEPLRNAHHPYRLCCAREGTEDFITQLRALKSALKGEDNGK